MIKGTCDNEVIDHEDGSYDQIEVLVINGTVTLNVEPSEPRPLDPRHFACSVEEARAFHKVLGRVLERLS